MKSMTEIPMIPKEEHINRSVKIKYTGQVPIVMKISALGGDKM